MNIKTISNLLAAMLVLMGVSMIIPALIALGYGEPDFNGHLQSFAICVLIGLPIWAFTRNNRSLNSKDGFAMPQYL